MAEKTRLSDLAFWLAGRVVALLIVVTVIVWFGSDGSLSSEAIGGLLGLAGIAVLAFVIGIAARFLEGR